MSRDWPPGPAPRAGGGGDGMTGGWAKRDDGGCRPVRAERGVEGAVVDGGMEDDVPG